MNNTFYNGVPVEKVDFKLEARNELEKIKRKIAEMEEKLDNIDDNSVIHQIYAIRLSRANAKLEREESTLD